MRMGVIGEYLLSLGPDGDKDAPLVVVDEITAAAVLLAAVSVADNLSSFALILKVTTDSQSETWRVVEVVDYLEDDDEVEDLSQVLPFLPTAPVDDV